MFRNTVDLYVGFRDVSLQLSFEMVCDDGSIRRKDVDCERMRDIRQCARYSPEVQRLRQGELAHNNAHSRLSTHAAAYKMRRSRAQECLDGNSNCSHRREANNNSLGSCIQAGHQYGPSMQLGLTFRVVAPTIHIHLRLEINQTGQSSYYKVGVTTTGWFAKPIIVRVI